MTQANKIMSAPENERLKIECLCHSYQEGHSAHKILDDLNLAVEPGEFVAILGRSGCGKSTLLNLISGIEAIQSGNISLGDLSLSNMNETQRTLFRRANIGFIYQFFHLFPTLTAYENISAPMELNRAKPHIIDARVTSLLESVHLQENSAKYPDQLSGGEQQRVAIARALAHQPRLILADEPTGSLDLETGETVLDLMASAVKPSDATLLLVTHSLSVASRADRILTMEHGKLEERSGSFAW